jgi:hypothetical protein
MKNEKVKSRSRIVGYFSLLFAMFMLYSMVRHDKYFIDIWVITIYPIIMGVLFIIHNKFAVFLLTGYVLLFLFASINTSFHLRTIGPVIFCSVFLLIPFYFFMRWWKTIHTELKNDTVEKEQEK